MHCIYCRHERYICTAHARLAHSLLQPILSLDQSSVFEGDDMAKKQAAEPHPKIVASQPNAITIRGSAVGSHGWRTSRAQMRTRASAVIDLALAKLAHQEGFREPPPRI